MKGLSVRLWRLLANWFWRIDAFFGGSARPNIGRRFAASHPVLGALIVGPIYGVLFGILLLLLDVPFTLSALLACLGIAVGSGLCFMGLDYFERWRQRHYGHYPHEIQDETDSQA
ncbi:hypothetical protein [Nonomuraea sp. NPDC048916]|uniref:hypothetical protein n=1 Tax=Nonomuraea sp. NPDC048916 TaxID=3154232 RepID=UPI0033FDB0D9